MTEFELYSGKKLIQLLDDLNETTQIHIFLRSNHPLC